MKRMLCAVCAAAMLTGSLTACSMGTTDTNKMIRTGTSPSGTAYTAPARYPNGYDLDRDSYHRMSDTKDHAGTSAKKRNPGRYTAYSDGTLNDDYRDDTKNSPLMEDMGRRVRDLAGDVKDMGKDLTKDAKDMGKDLTKDAKDMGRDVKNDLTSAARNGDNRMKSNMTNSNLE